MPESELAEARQLLDLCTDTFGRDEVDVAGELLPLLALEPHVDVTGWLRGNIDEARDVVRLTRSRGIPAAVSVAAVALLHVDRYRLARFWSERWVYTDLQVIAAAACERVPADDR